MICNTLHCSSTAHDTTSKLATTPCTTRRNYTGAPEDSRESVQGAAQLQWASWCMQKGTFCVTTLTSLQHARFGLPVHLQAKRDTVLQKTEVTAKHGFIRMSLRNWRSFTSYGEVSCRNTLHVATQRRSLCDSSVRAACGQAKDRLDF